MEQQRGANAHRRAAHCRYQRLGKGGNAAQKAKYGRLLVRDRAVQKIANVIARTKYRGVAL